MSMKQLIKDEINILKGTIGTKVLRAIYEDFEDVYHEMLSIDVVNLRFLDHGLVTELDIYVKIEGIKITDELREHVTLKGYNILKEEKDSMYLKVL